MLQSVTAADIAAAVQSARDTATELDELFANNTMTSLLSNGKITFVYHPEVMKGTLGEAYKAGTEQWAHNGALRQLIQILGNNPRFTAGSFGSVWLDADLTGGVGSQVRTKKTRVTPTRNGTTGFFLML
ncbi:hypothetical protein N9S81_00565, partial [bacterium]|nr:hypothetical protein [bacterium]